MQQHPKVPVPFGLASINDAIVVSESIRIDIPGDDDNQDDISFFSNLKYVPRARTETLAATCNKTSDINIYVPPNARNNDSSRRRNTQDTFHTVRIGNLPLSITTESELSNSEILRKFKYKRLKFLAHGHNAFVHFSSYKEAANCAETLDGFRYENVVLEAAVLPPRQNLA